MAGPQVESWECISWKFAKGFIAEEFPNRKKLLIILGCCTLRSGWDIGLIGRFRSTYFFTMTIDIVQTYIRAVISLRLSDFSIQRQILADLEAGRLNTAHIRRIIIHGW